jgi:hypothetical protein
VALPMTRGRAPQRFGRLTRQRVHHIGRCAATIAALTKGSMMDLARASMDLP